MTTSTTTTTTATTTIKGKKKKCRYDPNCSVPNCSFDHPSKNSIAVTSKKSIKSCRYGSKCNKPKCRFSHPPKASPVPVAVAVSKNDDNDTTTKNESNKATTKKSKKCRFGSKCGRKNCKFLHPSPPTNNGSVDVPSVPQTIETNDQPGVVIPNDQILFAADLEEIMLQQTKTQEEHEEHPHKQLNVDKLKDDDQEEQHLVEAERLVQGMVDFVGIDDSLPPILKAAASPKRETVPTKKPVKDSKTGSSTEKRVTQSREKRETKKENSNKTNKPSMKQTPQQILRSMGFNETDANDALYEVNGDLDRAVEHLMLNPPQEQVDTSNPVQQVKNILGNVDTKQVEQLLKKTNGDINLAIEVYLTQEQSTASNNAVINASDIHEEKKDDTPLGEDTNVIHNKQERKKTIKKKRQKKSKQKSVPVKAKGGTMTPQPSSVDELAHDERIVQFENEFVRDEESELHLPDSPGPTDKEKQESALAQLKDMGFDDEKDAIEALDKSNGVVNFAVEYLTALEAEKRVRAAKEEEEKLRAERLQKEEAERKQKAARKAAKKERQRLKKQEAKAVADLQNSTADDIALVDDPEEELDEEEKKRRFREKWRIDKERAAAKKEQKKNRRHQKYREENETQTQERENFWKESIEEEKVVMDLLVKLCIAEVCRLNSILDQRLVRDDTKIKSLITEACHHAFRFLYKGAFPRRVILKGMNQQDLNDRTGTIDCWDDDKKKFCVYLDTNKGKQEQVTYVPPSNLEAIPGFKDKNKMSDPVHTVRIKSLFQGKDFSMDIFKSDVDRMKLATSVESFLVTFMREREMEDALREQQEEEERQREAEERARRARRRQREQQEWEERQRQYAEQKRQYQEYINQCRRDEEEAASRAYARRREQEEAAYRRDRTRCKSRNCSCARCQFEHMFFGKGGHFSFFVDPFTGSVFFGVPPGDYYDDDDDPYIFDDDPYYSYDDDGDGWDRAWNRMHEEEEEEKDQEAADMLGVDVDAGRDEIKRVFRKKALRFHPDKYRVDDNHGMTKDEAESYFKDLSNAYDHMMSKFD